MSEFACELLGHLLHQAAFAGECATETQDPGTIARRRPVRPQDVHGAFMQIGAGEGGAKRRTSRSRAA
ncbi:MAG: hypothetical protein V3S01_08990 [Dehalococcoidia bacterium]